MGCRRWLGFEGGVGVVGQGGQHQHTLLHRNHHVLVLHRQHPRRHQRAQAVARWADEFDRHAHCQHDHTVRVCVCEKECVCSCVCVHV